MHSRLRHLCCARSRADEEAVDDTVLIYRHARVFLTVLRMFPDDGWGWGGGGCEGPLPLYV
eukprot:2385654-Rhodomonas_salina.2